MTHEVISVFDMYKIGIGPSSSHTLGPWRAVQMWQKEMEHEINLIELKNIQIVLYGSLALTGKGHYTDKAICLALLGYDHETINVEDISPLIENLFERKNIFFCKKEINFNPEKDIVFEPNIQLNYHANAIKCIAVGKRKNIESIYYSTGGGFVEKGDMKPLLNNNHKLPFPCQTPSQLLSYCNNQKMSIAELVWENEKSWRDKDQVMQKMLTIWQEMKECLYKGCNTQGILPGGLNVKRHAYNLNKSLLPTKNYKNPDEWIMQISNSNFSFNQILRWISCFALAVNEENASMGRVVTAPTNGAAGVIPAVLLYYICFSGRKVTDSVIVNFLIVAGEVGTFFKKRATISAAMGGCQAEIGVSSSMAAAALCETLGGTPAQALMAAEISMEHHLGMTCDPVGGLVQIPCIERNAMGAIKAISAAEMALEKNPADAKITLDQVILTMWETAKDMNSKYKETSQGGLAVSVNIPEC